MGWFSKVTKSIGGGIGNLFGGIIGGASKPVVEGASTLLSNPNVAGALGGVGSFGGLMNMFGLGGGGESPTPNQTSQQPQQMNPILLLLGGGVLLWILYKFIK